MKKISKKRKKKLEIEAGERNIMLNLFVQIWQSRPHKSEISGKNLGAEPLTTYFHHILPKSKYPEQTLNPDNIILLTFEEHQKVEQDMYFYEEINKRREQLLCDL